MGVRDSFYLLARVSSMFIVQLLTPWGSMKSSKCKIPDHFYSIMFVTTES